MKKLEKPLKKKSRKKVQLFSINAGPTFGECGGTFGTCHHDFDVCNDDKSKC